FPGSARPRSLVEPVHQRADQRGHLRPGNRALRRLEPPRRWENGACRSVADYPCAAASSYRSLVESRRAWTDRDAAASAGEARRGSRRGRRSDGRPAGALREVLPGHRSKAARTAEAAALREDAGPEDDHGEEHSAQVPHPDALREADLLRADVGPDAARDR